MIYLLYLLLIAFIVIESPLVIIFIYLIKRKNLNGDSLRMRNIIIVIVLAKIFFILAQIILIINAIGYFQLGLVIVIPSYTITTLLLAYANWWALFKVQEIIK